MGIAFPLFVNVYVKLYGRVGRGIGNLYSSNTLGAILGSLCMGFFMIPRFGLFQSIILMGGIYFSVSFALIIINTREVLSTRFIKVVAFLLLAVIITSQTDMDVTHFIEKTLESEESGTNEKLIYFKEHATGAVMIKKSRYRGKEMLIDGIQVASTGDFDLHSHLFPSHLMGLLKKDIDDVLIVAFGCGGTSGSMLLYDEIQTMDVVEICKGVKEPAKLYFGDMNLNVFDDPRLNLIIQDGKNYMIMTERKYDVIYSGPIHPQSNQSSAGLYTLDYFKDCKERLKENGLQCLWLPIHMSSPKYFKIIVKSFLEVYPHVTLWMLPQTMSSASHPHLIGSKIPIYPDYELISQRLNRPKILKDIQRLNKTSFKKPSEFISFLTMDEKNLKILVDDIDTLNTDDQPVVEFYKRSNNLLLESKRTKAFLMGEIRKLMINPYELVSNIPGEKMKDLKQELNTFFKGYKYLLMGHCLLIYNNYFNFDSDSRAKIVRSLEGAYEKAFELMPGNLYLQNYFND
jgi:spermidine synthase